MSDETKVTCPKCHHKFVLTEALAGPLLEAERKASQEREQQLLVSAERSLEDATAKALRKGEEVAKASFAEDMDRTTRKAADAAEALRTAQRLITEQDVKLATAQTAQAEAVRKTRELEEARRELDLTIQQRVGDELGQARAKARSEADAENALKLAEKEKALSELREQLTEATRKAEHTDNRIQGEVQELELARMLAEAFPRDLVLDVAKGVHGGDSILRIQVGASEAGCILFESKRTKTYDQKWLAKLREDQRAAGADVAVLVTQTLPKGIDTFALVEGVWICSLALAVPLSAALRAGIQETYAARKASEGQETKAEAVYQYLTGLKFKARMTAAIEAVAGLQSDLVKERAAIERQWAKRESTHQRLVGTIVGMSGDLGGIAEGDVAAIDGIDMAALGAT